MLRTTLRKTAAILMLVSFVFGTAVPAAASPFTTLPSLNNTTNLVRYANGQQWYVISGGAKLFTTGSLYSTTWPNAKNNGVNYTNTLSVDEFESRIKGGSSLLSTGEVNGLNNNVRSGKGNWWTSTGAGGDRGYLWYGTYMEKRHGYKSFGFRPALSIANSGNIYYLNAYTGGAKSAGIGVITTEADNKSQMKFTYKDETLAAPTIGGGAMTLDAAGVSSWYTDTENRVAASVGNADMLAADGYMLMQDAGADHKLILGGMGNYNGMEDLYLHQEITGTNYDRMGTESLRISDLGLNLTYADGKLVAMTLPELYGTAENAITLNNGFELTLSGDSYAQDITAASGGGTLISNSTGTTLSGNTSLTGILTYDGKFLNTGTISGGGGLNILETATLETDAGKTQAGSGITNDGQLRLTGGSTDAPAEFVSAVTGSGTTTIAGTVKAKADLATTNIVEAGKKLIIDPDNLKGNLYLAGALYSGSDVVTKHTPDPSTLAIVETDNNGYFGVSVGGIGKAILNHDVTMSNTAGFDTAYFMDLTCAEKYKLKVADLIAGGKTPAEAQAEAYPLLVPAYIDDLTFASATGSQRYILYKMQTEGIKEKYKVTAEEAAAASADPRFAGLEAGDYRPIIPMSYISADVNAKMSVGDANINSGALVDLKVGTNGHIDLVNNKAGALIAKNFTAEEGSKLSLDVVNDDVMDAFLVMEDASGNLALGTVNVMSELITRADDDGWYVDAEGNHLDKNGQITTNPDEYINPKQLSGTGYVTSWKDIPIYGADNLSIAETSAIYGKYLYTISYEANPGQADDKQLKIVKTIGYSLREILQGYVEQRSARALKANFHAATVGTYSFSGDMINLGVVTATTKDTGETITADVGGGNLGILTRKDAGGATPSQDDNGYGSYTEDEHGFVTGLDPVGGRGGKLGGNTARTFSLSGNNSRLFGGGYEGVTVQEGDTFQIAGISMFDDFKDGLLGKNDGTFEITSGGTLEAAPGVQLENTLLLNASVTKNSEDSEGKIKINGADVILGGEASNYTFEYDVYKNKPTDIETQEIVVGDTAYYVTGRAVGKTAVAPVTINQDKLEILKGSLTANASQLTLTSAIENTGGTLNFTGGTNANKITGSGTLNITGSVQNNAPVEQKYLNVAADGVLTTDAGALSIAEGIIDLGTLNFTGGENNNKITGTGILNITGDVQNNAVITLPTISAAEGNTLTNNASAEISAANLTGTIVNKENGTITAENADVTLTNSGEFAADTLKGSADNKETGTITANTVDEAGVTNAGQFTADTMTGSLKNKQTGTAVIAGEYNGTVENSGKFAADTLKGSADNKETGIITVNTVDEADVTNAGQFTADTMTGTIDNKETGTITAERISSVISENAGKITVTDLDSATANNSGEINLNNLNGGNVANDGTLNLFGGKLEGKITGSGITNVMNGEVENFAEIAQNVTVKSEAEFTTNLDKLKGENVTNEGETIITGGSTAAGFTNSGAVTFAEGVNNAQIAAGKTAFRETSVLNFTLDGHKHQDTILTSSDGEKFDISAMPKENINLIHNGKGSILKVPGEYIILINGVSGYNGSSSRNNPDEVTALDSEKALTGYLYDMYSFQNNLYAAYHDITVLERAKSLSEGRMAAISAINNASDLIADKVTYEISTLENDGREWTSFVSIQGSRGHYETGSYIDMTGSNVAAGLAKKVSANTTIGVFAEGGWSRYNSNNEFNSFGTVTAKGDINHFGGGILLKTEADPTDKGSLYGEASVRAGHVSQDYSSENLLPASRIDYNSGSRYLAAHAGVGYSHKLKSGNTMDTYVKYLYAHQGGDDTTLSYTNEEVNFKPIESHRLRAGFRYNKIVDANFKAYGGLAYEYEFSNEAAATTSGLAIAEPELKGGTGVAELGVSYKKAGNPLAFDFTVTGAAGKRESINATLTTWYEFGEKAVAEKNLKPAKTKETTKKPEKQQTTEEVKTTQTNNWTERFETMFGGRRSKTEKIDRKTLDVSERQQQINEQLTTIAAEQKQAENKTQAATDSKRKGCGMYNGTLPAYIPEKKKSQIEGQYVEVEKESRPEKREKPEKTLIPGYDAKTGEINGIGVLESLLLTTQEERLPESVAAKETKETKKQAYAAVQIGASQNKEACEGIAAKARKAGFDAKVITVRKGRVAMYRVRVSSDSQTPQALLKQLQAKGFDGFVVKD